MVPLKVVLTTDVYHPMMSGVTRVIDILVEELPRYGIKYEVLAPILQKSALTVRRLNGGVLIGLRAFRLRGIYGEMPVPEPFSPMLALKVHRDKLFSDLTVVHAHTPYVATTILRVALSRGKDGRVPIILTFHTLVNKYIDYRFGRFGAILKIMDKAMLSNVFNRCDYIVFPSRYAMNITMNYLGKDRMKKIKKKFVLIRNPIPREIFAEPKRSIEEYYDFLSEYNYAVWVGRISHEKNLPFIMKIFSGLPFDLAIAGKGPLLSSLKRVAPKNIHFLGFVPDDVLRSLLHYARLMIIASEFDNMPLAVLEAMAQGVPVVSYFEGGHNEIIEDGVNGYKYRTASEAKRFISLIFRDDDLLWRLRDGAKKTAMMFHPDNIIPKYVSLYKEILG